MTALEKLCENEEIKHPFDFVQWNCPEDAGINIDYPDGCPCMSGRWTRQDEIKCVRCWTREVVD